MASIHRWLKTQFEGCATPQWMALPSVPIAYSCIMKESHENMKLMLNEIDYSHHNWNI